VLPGFVAFLFGFFGVEEARHQNTLFKTFSYQLSQALAPVGPTTPGASVAVLSVPRTGLQNVVVVEGSTSRNLTAGPGQLRSTPLPGQAGTSIIFGKRSTYGAPFADLLQMQIGDVITVTTGQGGSALPGHVVRQLPEPRAGQLHQPAGAAHGSRSPAVRGIHLGQCRPRRQAAAVAGQPAADLVARHRDAGRRRRRHGAAAALGAGAGPGGSLGTLGYYRWSRSATGIYLVPIAAAVLWNVFENVAALRPNLF